MDKNKPLTIGFVSTYPPRECGIATYTQNLEKGINLYNPIFRIKIIAINDAKYDYPQKVVCEIEQNDNKSYIKAAKFINNSDIDVVSLQHEFGIFGGFNGNKILYLLKHLKKPIIMTLHTAPISSTYPIRFTAKRRKSRIKLLKKIIPYLKGITVMIETTKKYLSDDLNLSKSKITVIPHGAPEISKEMLNKYKKEKTLLGFAENDFVLTTFGLISPKKGLEYMIGALPKIIAKNPGIKIKYLIAGRMHPKKPISYLYGLKKLAKSLKVEKNVIYDTRYLSFTEIYKYLANTNIYVTPYYSKEQSSSGTLSYAIATGKCIVSTPYPFAKEMIENIMIGEPIKFRNAKSISNKINYLIENRDLIKQYEEKSYKFGKTIYWDKVTEKYIKLFEKAKKGNLT